MEKEIQQLGRFFDIKEQDLELYKLLLSEGESTAGRLSKKVSVSRPAVYEGLERLVEKGLVVETVVDGVKTFVAQSFSNISLLLEEKQSDIEHAETALKHLEEEYADIGQFKTPRLQVYEGKEGVQQMFKSTLLKRNTTIRSLFPIEKMLEVFTPEFLEEYDARRLALNLNAKVIWPQISKNFFEKYSHLAPGVETMREIRFVPKDTDFSLGYNVCGDTVIFISSKRENFGFMVKSDELAQTMIAQFDLLWDRLKPTKIKL